MNPVQQPVLSFEQAGFLTTRCFIAPTFRAEEAAGASELFHLTGSKAEDIDAHQDGTAGVRRNIPREAVFEIYYEAHEPPVAYLTRQTTE